MKNLINRIYQRGVTLFEALLVMFVGAVIIGGVVVLYNTVTTNVNTSNLISGIQQIAAGVHNTYIGGTGYDANVGSVAKSVAPLGTSPDWTNSGGNGQQTPFWTASNKSVWSAAAAGTGNFYVTVTLLPASACSATISAGLAGGATAACATAYSAACTFTTAGAAAAANPCAAGSTVTLVYS